MHLDLSFSAPSGPIRMRSDIFNTYSSRAFSDIFCFLVIPNLNFKKIRRQAAAKVKNQGSAKKAHIST